MKTLKELQKIQKDEKEEAKRIELSIQLGFCPICGAKLITIKPRYKIKFYKYWFNIKIRLDLWESKLICSNVESHYGVENHYDPIDYCM